MDDEFELPDSNLYFGITPLKNGVHMSHISCEKGRVISINSNRAIRSGYDRIARFKSTLFNIIGLY